MPSAFIDSTRSNPGTAGGGIPMDCLRLGGTKTISTDLARFIRRLLSRAHSSTFVCLFVCLLLNGTSALFRPLVPRRERSLIHTSLHYMQE